MKDQRVSLSEDVIPNFNDICNDLAKITEGMSGREIEKMCSNVYVSVKIWFTFMKAGSLSGICSFERRSRYRPSRARNSCEGVQEPERRES